MEFTIEPLRRLFPFLLLASYGLFMCGYFFLEDYSNQYRLFSRFVFFFGLFVFVAGIRANYRHPVFQAIAIYMLYLLFSGFWRDPMDWFLLGQKFVISVYILSFITITYFLVQWNRGLFERLIQLCIVVAAVAALINIFVFYSDNPFPSTRLMGIGALTNINEFANVYGVYALLAAGLALRTQNISYKVLLLVAIGIFMSYAWFGQSRTAFVSLIVALMALVGATVQEKRWLYAAVALLATFGAALVVMFPDTLEQAVLRGIGLRPHIWASTWEKAVLSPIIGHGLTMDIAVQAGGRLIETAHNAYLQVFWEAGAIGLFLLLVLLLLAFRSAWSLGREMGDYTIFSLLVFASITMLTGVDTLIARPRDQWMLFWLPLALLLSYQSHSTLTTLPGPRARKPGGALDR